MIARRDAHIALHAPHRRGSSGLALSIHIMALHTATHRHPKARPHHAALGLLPEVALRAAVRCGHDVHVIARRQRRALRGHHIAAGDVHIIARTHRHGVARESAAHVPAVAAGIIRLDRSGCEQATRAVLVFISCTAGFVGRLDAHITSGRCTERALGHDLRALGHHVQTGADADVVAADLRAHILAAGQRGDVAAVDGSAQVVDILRRPAVTSLSLRARPKVWQPASETKFHSARSINYLHQAPNVHMERIRTNAVITTIQ